MLFNISSSVLTTTLVQLSKTIASKGVIPILDCILFSLDGETGRLSLMTSDGEITTQASLDVSEWEGTGSIAINASQIINAVKVIADQPIKITIDEKTFNILIEYQNGKCSFVGLSGKEYPMPPTLPTDCQSCEVPALVLESGTSGTSIAVANDELRPVMNGVLLDFTDAGLTFVGTDGHKLVKDCYSYYEKEQYAHLLGKSVILPKKLARLTRDAVMKSDSSVQIQFTDNQMKLATEKYTITSRLIEGRYPKYDAVIPQTYTTKVVFDKALLVGALRRVLVFASSATELVSLGFSAGKLLVKATDNDFNTSAKESVACDYDGDEVTIGVKCSQLIELLGVIKTQEVEVSFESPTRPILLKPIYPATEDDKQASPTPDTTMLLMPMMIQ